MYLKSSGLFHYRVDVRLYLVHLPKIVIIGEQKSMRVKPSERKYIKHE